MMPLPQRAMNKPKAPMTLYKPRHNLQQNLMHNLRHNLRQNRQNLRHNLKHNLRQMMKLKQTRKHKR